MTMVIAPSVSTRYRQPQLFSFVQVLASEHEKLGMKPQASALFG